MFTGIIEELGKIQTLTNNKIVIEASLVLQEAKLGDSIAVNGICLTISDMDSKSFTADVSYETFRITAFQTLKQGDFVNLERAMLCNGRFGGHIVSGHIDDVAKLVSVEKKGEFYSLRIELPNKLLKYVVKKGSITINGISLTIADINNNNIITLAIIPHTYEFTNLKTLKYGDIVNIEVDILAKYVEKFLSSGDNRSNIDLAFLQENGF